MPPDPGQCLFDRRKSEVDGFKQSNFGSCRIIRCKEFKMELFALIFLGLCGLFVFMAVRTILATGRPKHVKTLGVVSFDNVLPSGFGYKYYNDNSGFAFNFDELSVLLFNKGKYKIYNFTQIRNVERKWIEPGKHRVIGGSLGHAAQARRINHKESIAAYNDSGLFISMIDIDDPMWQVKFVNETDLYRAFEIFSQAMDGAYSKQSLQKTGKDEFELK